MDIDKQSTEKKILAQFVTLTLPVITQSYLTLIVGGLLGPNY